MHPGTLTLQPLDGGPRLLQVAVVRLPLLARLLARLVRLFLLRAQLLLGLLRVVLCLPGRLAAPGSGPAPAPPPPAPPVAPPPRAPAAPAPQGRRTGPTGPCGRAPTPAPAAPPPTASPTAPTPCAAGPPARGAAGPDCPP